MHDYISFSHNQLLTHLEWCWDVLINDMCSINVISSSHGPVSLSSTIVVIFYTKNFENICIIMTNLLKIFHQNLNKVETIFSAISTAVSCVLST